MLKNMLQQAAKAITVEEFNLIIDDIKGISLLTQIWSKVNLDIGVELVMTH